MPEISYAQIAGTAVQPNIIQNQETPTNDLSELKTMMKGLMEQMGTMINLLTTVVAKLVK